MRSASLTAAGLSGFLVACCPPVKTTSEVVKVETIRRVPVPAELTKPCIHDGEPIYVGDLIREYERARATIAECDDRLARIRALK